MLSRGDWFRVQQRQHLGSFDCTLQTLHDLHQLLIRADCAIWFEQQEVIVLLPLNVELCSFTLQGEHSLLQLI